MYYTALENNLTSASTFSSEPSTFTMEKNKSYSPQNYGNKYANKEITMAAAIALSDNIYAVKTNMFLGGNKLVNTIKRSGIKEKMNNVPSLPLGTTEISMIDYAQGYQTISNEGKLIPIHLINKVLDSDDNVLYEFDDTEYEVLNNNYTYILSEMLNNTYSNSFKDYTNPTALTIANKLNEKYAIKTGTTNTDFWTIGYNKDKLMMVWCGNDDASEVNPSKNYITKNIFAETVSKIKNNSLSDTWYTKPEDVIGVLLDPITGEETKDSSKAALFYFIKGSEKKLKKE